MLISNKFSSAISVSACSIALLSAVGCSNDGLLEPDQPQAQAASTQNQAATQSTTNTQTAKAVTGTTRGRVSKVNADGSLVVLGQTIYVSTSTNFVGVSPTGITVGDYINVDASVDGSGRIVAAAITLDTSFDPIVTLMGVVTNVDFDNKTFQVGDITVGFDAIDFANFDSANLSNGMVVEMTADEQNFDAGFAQIAVDSISVLDNGTTVNAATNGVIVSNDDGAVIVNQDGVSVTDENGSVVVGPDGVFVNTNGESVVVGENGVSVNDDGSVVVGPNGVLVNVDGNTVVVGQDGVSVNADGTVVIGPTGIAVNSEDSVVVDTTGITVSAENETIVVGESGVVVNDSNGTTSVTTDGISIDNVDLQETITDTANDTLNETLNDILDLGDLNAYDYSEIKLSSSSNCLSVGAPTHFQVTGDTIDSMNAPVTHNLSGQVSINSDLPHVLDIAASDGTGLYLNMYDQNIVEMQIVAGDTTLTHYIGAIPSNVERPVVLAKQTANWCSFIIFEQDNCTSITNQVTGVSATAGQTVVDAAPTGTLLNAGQTVVDTSSAGTIITIDGEPLVATESNQWLSENGMADSVSSHSGVTVSGCTLSNPENIPVITVK